MQHEVSIVTKAGKAKTIAREPGKFAELQAFLDMAVNSGRVLKLSFANPEEARSFRNRFYKKRNEWRTVFLKHNASLVDHPLNPENLRHVDPELINQIREQYPNMKRIQPYHWQSPYQLVSCRIPEDAEETVLLYNTMYVREPNSSVLAYEFVD